MKFAFGTIIPINCALSATMAQSPALLTAFRKPAPSKDDLFGRSVAALGSDRVIIGASGRTSDNANDTVYLFTTNGLLLTTFTNPSPSIATVQRFIARYRRKTPFFGHLCLPQHAAARI
jgi:hypothetical protein